MASQPVTLRQKTNAIRQAVSDAGYAFWISYCDKRKGHHRIKLMQNGYHHKPEQYAKWDKSIKARLQARGVKVETAGFENLDRYGYGPYVAYVVRIKS